MDSKHIEQLLEKYWNAETSLEEEQELRAYFGGASVADSLKETAVLFRYFEAEKKKSVEESFEKVVTNEIKQRHSGKVVKMITFTQMARIAAGIFVVVVAGYFIRMEVRKAYPEEIAVTDTYNDPKIAFEETKKALMMISKSFGRAKSETEKIKMFNEAEKKIQGKVEEKKENIQI
jgi:hypothetical protein